MTICSLNAQSVKNKALSISGLITDRDIDILALTETWLGTAFDQQVLCELVPSGYTVVNVPRLGNKRGGGVALIHKCGLSVSLVTSTTDKQYTQFEYADFTIKSKIALLDFV
jgi:hypothetical protein